MTTESTGKSLHLDCVLQKDLEARIELLEHNLGQLIPPIQDFIKKVEEGRATSKDSYGKFKQALNNLKP